MARWRHAGAVFGRVISRATGYPVVGAEVALLRGDTEVDRATSARHGRFVLARAARVLEPRSSLQPLVLLTALPGEGGAPTRTELPPGSLAMPLDVEVEIPPASLADTDWQRVAEIAREHQAATVHQLAVALVLEGSAGGLTLAKRHAALAALGESLRRTRDGSGFGDPFSDARRVDLGSLATGALRESVLEALDVTEIELHPELIDGLGRWIPAVAAARLSMDPRDLVDYRDYLVAIWVAHCEESSKQEAPVDLLSRRFHQDFATQDRLLRPVDELLAATVRRALIADTGAFGFGRDADAVPPASAELLADLLEESGVTPREFALRYRLDFERPSDAFSSPVRENVFTLQRFFSDSFQIRDEPDPFPDELIADGVELPYHHGYDHLHRPPAPFFLQYEEWLRVRAPYFGENFLPLGDAFGPNFGPRAARKMEEAEVDLSQKPDTLTLENWAPLLHRVELALRAGRAALLAGRNREAATRYGEAAELARVALGRVPTIGSRKPMTSEERQAELEARAGMPVTGPVSLRELQGKYRLAEQEYTPGPNPTSPLKSWWEYPGITNRMQVGLGYTLEVLLPMYRVELALASQDWHRALEDCQPFTGFVVYEIDVDADAGAAVLRAPGTGSTVDTVWTSGFRDRESPPIAHPVELRWFHLAQGEAMLAMADDLYRTDAPDAIARARELYKGVFWLNGRVPDITPSWQETEPKPKLPGKDANPSLVGQLARARQALLQIDLHLNCLGGTDDLVPPLRYSTLKSAADDLVALAKSAERDFLGATKAAEDLAVETMKYSSLLTKARLQARISGHQVAKVDEEMKLAQAQVKAVHDAMETKRQEIEDASGLFDQMGRYFGGIKDMVSPVASSGAASGFGAAAKAGATGGEAAAAYGGVAAGGAVLGGMGAFLVVSYITLKGMADEDSDRRRQLTRLREEALPLAQAQVEAKRHEREIALLEGKIAETDVRLALDLLAFQRTRFLNEDFWLNFAAVMRRILRRYIDLATRTAWLAERAAAFETGERFSFIGFDYFQARLRGATGPERLEADLAELEAARLAATRTALPVKHTYSLARDFPLAFESLRSTGRCEFGTDAAHLEAAFPGTCEHRLKTVRVGTLLGDGVEPLRATLINPGASTVTGRDGKRRSLIRPADAMAISEFRLADDLDVYGLPDETLFPFEGSGVSTSWELVCDAERSAPVLEGIVDVLITFDCRARFIPHREKTTPEAFSKFALVSARRHAPDGFLALKQDPASDTVTIDLEALPVGEGRAVTNIAVIAAGLQSDTVPVALSCAATASPVSFELSDGVILSRNLPDGGAAGPGTPLDALAGTPLAQEWLIDLGPARAAGVDLSRLEDLLLAVEYA